MFRGPVKVSYTGTLHDSPISNGTASGSSSASVAISRPEVTPSVTLGPAPALLAPPGAAGERAVVTDDACAPVTYVSGDTTASTPALLDPGETWTFTCTRTLAAPGTFVDHASVVGSSTLDDRPWPATGAESPVTVDPPAIAPPPLGPLKVLGVSSNRDGTVRLRVEVPGPGTLSVDDLRRSEKLRARRRNFVKPAAATVHAKRPVTLKLMPTKAAKRRVDRRGRLVVKAEMLFASPSGQTRNGRARLAFKVPAPGARRAGSRSP